MKLSPLDKLALHVVGWGVLTLLAFFFHVVAFCAVLGVLASKTLLFRFVYLNTKEYHDSTKEYEQLVIPGVDGKTSPD